MTTLEIALLIVFAFLSLPIGIVTHELAHAIVVWSYGHKVLAFKPYPHKKSNGKWTIGLISSSARGNCKLFYIAPLMKAFFFVVLFLVLGLAAYLPLLGFCLGELLDGLDWTKDYILDRKTQDAGKFRSCL